MICKFSIALLNGKIIEGEFDCEYHEYTEYYGGRWMTVSAEIGEFKNCTLSNEEKQEIADIGIDCWYIEDCGVYEFSENDFMELIKINEKAGG